MSRNTLLMVHGLVGSLDYFDPGTLITRAQARPCDLPGYGTQRDAPSHELSLSRQADYIVDLMEKLGGQPLWLLGHSMGGAVVLLAADRCPELVAGIINVEGNFTLQDAFWSGQIVRRTPEKWDQEYRNMQADLPRWLSGCGVEPSTQRVEWARRILANQPAGTVFTMSQAIVTETGRPDYLAAIRRVVDRDLPIHLIAGQRSAAAWDVPAFVREAAASYAVQPGVGHLMMLEDPAGFCRLVDACFSTT